MTNTFTIGDAVFLPNDFCPGCGDNIGDQVTGLITATIPDDDVHWKLAEEHPGPYYRVLIDHDHAGPSNGLVYAAGELEAT
jgi:hypothetical protein